MGDYRDYRDHGSGGGRHRQAGRRRLRSLLLAGIPVFFVVAVVAARLSLAGGSAPKRTAGSPRAAGHQTGAPAAHSQGPAGSSQPAALPLAGKIVGIDPGHNGLNFSEPSALARQVWNGRSEENCDTTGTQTAGGYTEALFNFDVAMYLRADLIRDGARVAMTRYSNNGFGPCVDKRAEILNAAGADVSIDIHGDGGPVSGRGFTVLEPVADGPNDKVIAASDAFGADVHAAMLALTPFGVSDYYGVDGYIQRDDLAGLNLTTEPKVLIECGNMTNPADAALMVRPLVQREIARALEAAIVKFLTGG